MSKLKINAIGNLGHDCSIKHLDNGVTAINFSIACTEKYTDKSGTKHEKTTWVDCVLWRKPDKLKIADYLKKGTQVSIEGKPEVRAWNSKEGEARAAISVRVDELILLGGKSVAANQPAAESVQPAANAMNDSQPFVAATQEDDLPF